MDSSGPSSRKRITETTTPANNNDKKKNYNYNHNHNHNNHNKLEKKDTLDTLYPSLSLAQYASTSGSMAKPVSTSTSMPASTETAADTIELLESRLRRIEYLLTGEASWTGEPPRITTATGVGRGEKPATARLAELEYELKALANKVPAVRDVLGLYSRFPDLFQSIHNTNSTTSSSPSPTPALPTTLSQQALTSIILSYASAFPETASRLTSLKDLPIPPASLSASLIELQPRLDRLAAVQEQQALEIAELRARSALVAKRWVEVGVLGGSEVWAEWEGRIERVERGVRRLEGRREG
ncbi:hypothetical protein GX50_02311 [[Emmonsia] crescens]|uniref:Nuclear distribution protein n=1 Tax=[Emmonsia] crescens TaxID=73230 RepID=A0A2B7ZNA6_9EURO|nr:hypothetical protein GX50_02311 [Emmonsia crescens]